MKFTFEKLKSTGRNMDKKETITRWNLIAFQDGKFVDLITARWYMGRKNTSSLVYCTIWFNSPVFNKSHGDWTDASGSGYAGGGGYCKSSAAFYDAMCSAGIRCDEEISGRGMETVADALLALGKQAGFEHVKLVRG